MHSKMDEPVLEVAKGAFVDRLLMQRRELHSLAREACGGPAQPVWFAVSKRTTLDQAGLVDAREAKPLPQT
ncbi:hypothetical protein BDS110ZK25_82150 [Bradyrhizobium diazoefficiens]|uniref:Uncharacterized protein n=2 Tax=Bradyrhizobium TaxID=374 RepID=A0A809Z215_9BRAD|nr:hypothetical protein BKD09_43470 [Bradyrhizobium japonicum]BCA01030.1 hypothetical protein H12S4_19340 [Bradyrhizobium diazoefficiens]GLR95624.1 hypothetical protein GCM10007858_32600 [Bradyrhizobium liaoningense]BCA01341.1 hypothetical protein H12S4_22450 [Bradyrhizobium diazoefficiens]BCE19279.1 hypothetical protein XF1B_19600 [Bradyrhizobium diazoefficiens]